MSTRAIIQFTDEWGESYLVDRSHDGFPENVIPDIEKVVRAKENSWSGSEIGQLVAFFLMLCNRPGSRLATYSLIQDFPGDHNYTFYATYDKESGKWEQRPPKGEGES